MRAREGEGVLEVAERLGSLKRSLRNWKSMLNRDP